MNQNVTSKQEILKTCRDIVRQSGLMSLKIRSVAVEENIASGTVYNYFENKDELMGKQWKVHGVISSFWIVI